MSSSYWIFVIGQNHTGREVFEDKQKFEKFMKKEMCWGVGSNTPYTGNIRSGQRGVFYLTGKHGKFSFISSFKTKTEPIKISKEAEKSLSPIITYWSTYVIYLKEFNAFKKRVDIRKIADKLDLTKNKSSWGAALQGGIRKISEKDYRMIVSLSK